MTDFVSPSDWIAVDWGTSRVRAWLVSDQGDVKARRQSDDGMTHLSPGDFEPALLKLVEDLLMEGRCTTVVACGMVGSRQGWAEVKYRDIDGPTIDPGEIEKAPVNDPRLDVSIVAGLMQREPANVMRGEETQINGYLASNPNFTGTICLPGTHTKWVKVDNGDLVEFQTIMTGELFALLSERSILRFNVNSGEFDEPVFLTAVNSVRDDSLALTKGMFGLRAAALIDDISDVVTRSRLSGMVIGTELVSVKDYWNGKPVVIIGNDQLSGLYKSALSAQAVDTIATDADEMTVKGLFVAYRAVQEHNKCLAS